MAFEIGVENKFENRSLAWALEHPGCFAYGVNSESALANISEAIRNYDVWIARHNDGESWVKARVIELHLAETWDVYCIDQEFNPVEQGYQVNAWFRHDWKPLCEREVKRGFSLLAWSRGDLQKAVGGLDEGTLEAAHPGERWSISGILRHIGGAEWWYLDRLGLAIPQEQVPDEPFERLEIVRTRLVEILPTLVGLQQVVGVDGEFWSARKVLRRAVWHERDHTQHIHKLTQIHG